MRDMIESIAYDMIENVEAAHMADFLRMVDDYMAQMYMEELNREAASAEDFSDDLPF